MCLLSHEATERLSVYSIRLAGDGNPSRSDGFKIDYLDLGLRYLVP